MINYQIIADSIKHYAEKYNSIEVPWTVSKQTSEMTKPTWCQDYELKHNNKVLVASGEQSFLYLMIKGYLLPGKYQAVTPCFRDDSFDTMHRKYFIKNELIITDVVNMESLKSIVQDALNFFSKYLPKENFFIWDTSMDSFDIVYGIGENRYELGSYGIRKHDNLEWIYGTGCAEPRLTTVIQMQEKWDTTRKR